MMFQMPPVPPTALTVADITRYLRQLMDSDEILRDVWIRGEISNLSRPVSGHIYLTLKDESAALRAVIWKSNALRLRTALQNGMAVEAHGYISLYERDGAYQLYIDAVRLAGEGLLYQEFMRLKARLEADGLFDPARKRPLPARPGRIGLVTSPTGAALQDMLNTLGTRFPLAEVVLAPCAVQGVEAPLEVVRSLRALTRLGGVDVIIVGRGGGSLEDLWAFNDERVVRAIAASPVPVVTGIGHETDFSLADFASDARAPTPTGAAVMVTPNIADLRLELAQLAGRLGSAQQVRLELARSRWLESSTRLRRVSPLRRIQDDRQRLDQAQVRLERALGQTLRLEQARLHGVRERLRTLSPLAVLQRGYAVVQDSSGALVRRAAQVHPGQELSIRLSGGLVKATVKDIRQDPKQEPGAL
jgi:exodeoxyribonuclease VII large subunit